jgi:hypothetical protein
MCELPEVYGCKDRKARKDHKCCECHGIIGRGELYHYHHGIWDGEAMSFKVCVDCELLRKDCDRDAERGEGTPFEGLSDSVMSNPNALLFERYIAIKQKRGALISTSLMGYMQRRTGGSK